jgi:hypothetical protein
MTYLEGAKRTLADATGSDETLVCVTKGELRLLLTVRDSLAAVLDGQCGCRLCVGGRATLAALDQEQPT